MIQMNLPTKQKETHRLRKWSHVCWGKGIVREFGKVMYTLLYLKQIISKNLLHRTRNSAQCYVPAWMGGEFGGLWTHVYVWWNPFAILLKLPHHCQSAVCGCVLGCFSLCSTLCDPMDGSPSGSSVGSGLPCPPPGDIPHLGTEPVSSEAPVLQILYCLATRETHSSISYTPIQNKKFKAWKKKLMCTWKSPSTSQPHNEFNCPQ